MDFQIGDTASGNAADERDPSTVTPAGRLGVWPRGSARPTIRARGLRSRMAANSASGSRADSGCGVAPTFEHAMSDSIISIEFGNAMDT